MTMTTQSIPTQYSTTSNRLHWGVAALALLIGACFSSPSDSEEADTTGVGTGASSSGSDEVQGSQEGSDPSAGQTTAGGTVGLDTGTSGLDTGTSGLDTGTSGLDTGTAGVDGSTDGSESSSSGAAEESTGPGVGCGNGIVDAGEACDDGNDNELDSCTSECEEQFATGNDEVCSDSFAAHCDYFAAQCRMRVGGNDSTCYWPDATTLAECDGEPGIWTTPDSNYAQNNPEMNFLEPGVCITNTSNLSCSNASAAICSNAGADLCFESKPANGIGNLGAALCYWDVNEASCPAAGGIWTTPDSGFVQGQPNVLPNDDQAACITQVTNLE
ncbi:MAG: hypothetical protein JKY37_13165 [Nannocystaceae bacterium]|nr:hypothetical protein [Nannocystaceae bacterium]